MTSAQDHHAFVIRSPVMLSPTWLSTFIGAAFALPAKAMAIARPLAKPEPGNQRPTSPPALVSAVKALRWRMQERSSWNASQRLERVQSAQRVITNAQRS
jgi:hypothetical protein